MTSEQPTIERPAPWGAYLWQLIVAISATGIIGLTTWLINLESRVNNMGFMRADIARIEGGHDGNRTIIDRNSERLTKIEAQIEQLSDMRGQIRELMAEHQRLAIDVSRIYQNVPTTGFKIDSIPPSKR